MIGTLPHPFETFLVSIVGSHSSKETAQIPSKALHPECPNPYTMLDNKACSDPSGKQPSGLRIGIISGGMSGICMACKLLEALPGSEVTMFELNDQLGGTWYTHRYPGVACDSPSHLYSFWFSPNPGKLSPHEAQRGATFYFRERSSDFPALSML